MKLNVDNEILDTGYKITEDTLGGEVFDQYRKDLERLTKINDLLKYLNDPEQIEIYIRDCVSRYYNAPPEQMISELLDITGAQYGE